MINRLTSGCLFALGLCCSAVAWAEEPPKFVGQLEPKTKQTDLGEQLWQLDRQVQRNPRAIQPHKPIYFTTSYFDSNFDGAQVEGSPFDEGLEHTEVNFQISIRVPVVENFLRHNADLYVAYTSKAYWQAFNSEASSPFRDINHEPELFVLLPTQWSLGPILSRAVTLGFNHQSNGQTNNSLTDAQGEVVYESLSRSWNRIMLGAYFEQKNFHWHLQAWYRIPEEKKRRPYTGQGRR